MPLLEVRELEAGYGPIRALDRVSLDVNEGELVALIGAILLEQNDEWAVQRARYITLESVAQLSDDPLVTLPDMAA